MPRRRKVKMPKRQVKAKQRKRKSKSGISYADAGAAFGTAAGMGAALYTGSSMAIPMGTAIGRLLGTGISSIVGSGDYTMIGTAPGYNVLAGHPPKFSSTHATNIVCHREYIGDVLGGAAFFNDTFPLNPGVSETFPWLSQIAANYQEYKFHGIMFEFRPLITDFVTAGSPGVVVMATNYNSVAPAFTSKYEMENSEYAVSVKPTNALCHMVECKANQTVLKELYVRTGDVPSGQDARLYDLGLFQFARQSNPAINLGELWVTYCVEFFKPIIPTTVGQAIRAPSYRGITNDYTDATPLGTLIERVDTIGIQNFGNTLVFPNVTSNYMVHVEWIGTAATLVYPIFSGSSGLGINAANNFYGETSSNSAIPQAGVNSPNASITLYVEVLAGVGNVPTLTLGAGGTLPTGARTVNVYITSKGKATL
jgi:hypothetical protein